jgi:hypothetical protein
MSYVPFWKIHTGKGYRNAHKAVRGCVGCGEIKARTEFSRNQWLKGPDGNKCQVCINGGTTSSPRHRGGGGKGGGKERGDTPDVPLSSLTQELLQTHNDDQQQQQQEKSRGRRRTTTTTQSPHPYSQLERRQFNCPDCPRENRGTFVFFKQVPAVKPIVKCPQCKRAADWHNKKIMIENNTTITTQDRKVCRRLYPIPRGSEKGYGFYTCDQCNDKWGSSRAVMNIGQACFNCATTKNSPNHMVKPFRIEVPHNKKKKRGLGGRGMKRVPKEPIKEDEIEERGYGDADRQRNESGGGGGGAYGDLEDGTTTSYDIEPRETGGGGGEWIKVVGHNRRGIPERYRHRCEGCASGICKTKTLPKSEVHDVSDGNTVSTRASVVTNSSVDKSEFFDRDEDFSGFDDELLNNSSGQASDWVDV